MLRDVQLSQRVENGLLLFIVRSSDMAGDEPKWLYGRCRELEKGRLRRNNGYLHVKSIVDVMATS